ncbi:DUF3558 domain-containing protein [Actinophytocola sp.]|jgi:hypothetical protein|uniref:DUF3558 domain-containing protein n=1 Tax=Actinophytocola sp. TaxID=1872138 RepID=UPI002ED8D640
MILRALIGVAVLALTGCTETQAGTPRAADADVTTAPGSSSGAPTSGGDSPLAGIEPCDLLTAEEVAQLGVGNGQNDDVGDSPGCSWSKSGDFVLSVGLVTDVGIHDANLQGASPEPVNVGGHEAIRVQNQGGGEGGCAVLIATSDSSFVDITVITTSGSDTPRACGAAENVAGLVERKLP